MTHDPMPPTAIDRRRALRLAGGGAAALLALLAGVGPRRAGATPADVKDRLAEIGGSDAPRERVTLEMPTITDQGPLVPVRVHVDSPMTEDDHVKAIHIFAERNTVPEVATFHLGPANGIADVSTRIRVKETQIVVAAAVMNDGSVFIGKAMCRVVGGAGGCG